MELSIGKKIREFRKGQKWTQEELARKVGVTKQVVSNWERHISKPGHDDIFNLSKVFDIPYDMILGTHGNNKQINFVSEMHKEYYHHVRKQDSINKKNNRDIYIAGSNDLIEIIFSDANLEVYDKPLTKYDKFMLADILHILFSWKSDIQNDKK
jgi:transcriptional regulator with XRE-family HTH domain